jgi:hypothetical protein
MPGETGRIYSGVYYTAYIFMDLRSVSPKMYGGKKSPPQSNGSRIWRRKADFSQAGRWYCALDLTHAAERCADG